jgi:hypothetical protein
MAARLVLLLTICLGLVACGGETSSPDPTKRAAIAMASPGRTLTPTPMATSVASTPKPKPKPTPTAVPVPPKPAGVKFDTVVIEKSERYADITQTVTWRTPRSKGVEIRVYGVTKCIAAPTDPTPDTTGPCLVTGTPLPASVRTLLGKAPASDGAVSWSWTEETGCKVGLAHDPHGPAYDAVVLAAYGATGHSIFAIAEPGLWWEPGPTDVIC